MKNIYGTLAGIGLLLSATTRADTYGWLDFFRDWTAFNERNRRALFSEQESEQPTTRNKSRMESGAVRLADIKGGVPSAIYDLKNFLLDKDAFERAGAHPPKGILLVGAPGTGKTTIVKALAAEIGAPLIAASGSEFVEIYVGTGAKRVRELFQSARDALKTSGAKHAIIFIDELDAIGQRGQRNGSSEDQKTINELLTQMDGYASDNSITVIAATNYPDLIDPGLLRPGRFDEIITIELPEFSSRLEILEFYLYAPQFNRSVEGEISLEPLAHASSGWSGAELESVIKKAALIVARSKRKAIRQADLMTAFNEVKKMHTHRK